MKYLQTHLGALMGAYLFNIVGGNLYTWGSISIYVASYYRSFDEDVTVSRFLIIVPIYCVCLLLFSPISGPLHHRFSIRVPISIGVIAIPLGVFIAPSITNSWAFCFLIGCAFGLGDGFGYASSMDMIIEHYPNSEQLGVGSAMAMYSMSSVVFPWVAYSIVNPESKDPEIVVQNGQNEEKYYDEEIYDRVPNMFYILGIIWLVLLLLAVILMHNPDLSKMNGEARKEHKREKITKTLSLPAKGSMQKRSSIFSRSRTRKGSEYSTNTLVSVSLKYSLTVIGRSHDNDHCCQSIIQGISSRHFWGLLIMVLFAVNLLFLFIMCYKEFGVKYEYSDLFLTIVGTISSLTCAAGNIFWGWLNKRPSWNFKILSAIVTIGQSVCCLLLYLWGYSPVIFLLSVDVGLFFLGGRGVLFCVVCIQIFGKNHGPEIYGFLLSGMALGSLTLYFSAEYLVPVFGLETFMLVSAGCTILALFINICISLEPNWKKKKLDSQIIIDEQHNDQNNGENERAGEDKSYEEKS